MPLIKERSVSKTTTREQDDDDRQQPAVKVEVKRVGLDLHTKYRPTAFKQVVGQDPVVSSVSSLLKRGGTHAFIFIGPSGTGKTTLGRIIAKKLGCERQNLVEIDAATNSGVDAMRALTESMQFSGLGANPTRVYIIDECHMLSKAAWNSLLKSTEEPPQHVYWVLCTTEGDKIPATMKNQRFATYQLKPVSTNLLYELLEQVRTDEGYETPDDVLQLIASKSEGSPRRALAALAKCRDVQDRREAAELINIVSDEEEGDIGNLCRALLKGCTWEQAMDIVRPLQDQNPESIRNIVCNWMTKVLLGSEDRKGASGNRAAHVMTILAAFSKPYTTNNGIYPVLLSLGDVLLGS
jgi:DNA polymerase III gamma/tau subunit